MDEQEEITYYKTTSEFFSELSRLNIHLIQEFFDSVCKFVVKKFSWQICEIFVWIEQKDVAGLSRVSAWATLLNQNKIEYRQLVSQDKDLEEKREGNDFYSANSKSATISRILHDDILFCNDIRKSSEMSEYHLQKYEKDYENLLLDKKLKTFGAFPIIHKDRFKLGLLRVMNKYKVKRKGEYAFDNIDDKLEQQFFKDVAMSIQKVLVNKLHHKEQSETLAECAHAITKDTSPKQNLEKICETLGRRFNAKAEILDSDNPKAKEAFKNLSQVKKNKIEWKLKLYSPAKMEIIVPISLGEGKSPNFISLKRDGKVFSWEELVILDYLGDNFSIYKDLLEEISELRQVTRDRIGNIVGKHPKMQKVYSLIDAVADNNATLLITGETGTGKGVIARQIHNQSSRQSKPFIKVECPAIPEQLMESELFGHEKGAFTGAIARKLGKFESAEGGTIFLDEIGDMPPHLQTKLLRILEESEFERVGGTKTFKANVRIIAATNQNLEELVKQGKFRKDLYHRIDVIRINVPPLRERKEDMLLLVTYFMRIFSKEHKKKVKVISQEALDSIISYSWEGNVRELKNAVEYAVAFANENTINIENLPDKIKGESSLKIGESLQDKELSNILKCLAECGGNTTETAKKLNVDRKTIQNRIKPILESCWEESGNDLIRATNMVGHGWDTNLYKKKLEGFKIIKRELRQ